MLWYLKKCRTGEWKLVAKDIFHLIKIPECWQKKLDDLEHVEVEEQAKKEDRQRNPHFRLVEIGDGLWKLIYDAEVEEEGFLRWLCRE